MENIKELKKLLELSKNGFKDDGKSKIFTAKGYCNKHGVFTQYVKSFGINKFKYKSTTSCPECLKEKINKLEKEQNDIKDFKSKEEVKTLKKRSDIPLRFKDASFDNFKSDQKNAKALKICKAYAERWADRKKSGGSLVLFGNVGTGKTHLAMAIANYVIENYQDRVYVTTARKITRDIKSTWGDKENTEQGLINLYAKLDLLIIDEIGVQFLSDAEKMILFEIINNRYENIKPTLIISNLNSDEIKKTLGEQTVDRLREGRGAMVKFDWESYRK